MRFGYSSVSYHEIIAEIHDTRQVLPGKILIFQLVISTLVSSFLPSYISSEKRELLFEDSFTSYNGFKVEIILINLNFFINFFSQPIIFVTIEFD